jgi:hypothetical protein
VTVDRSPVFDATRIVIPFPLKCSSTHTAITLRLLSEVADKNARLLAISFSRERLRQWCESPLETKEFSFGPSGTSFSHRRRLMLSDNCCHVVVLPHIIDSKPCIMSHEYSSPSVLTKSALHGEVNSDVNRPRMYYGVRIFISQAWFHCGIEVFHPVR